MQFALVQLKDNRDRALSWVRFKLVQLRNRVWGRLRGPVLHVVVWSMSIYRLRLRGVVFVGVTGSVGKTTTKELTYAVLSSKYTGHKSRGTNNVLKEAVKSVIQTRRSHDFCVQEFGVGGLGEAVPNELQFKMIRPQVGVVTTVGDDHISALGSRAAIAAEKAKLIEALPAAGTAVLNADDPLVSAMRDRCRGRVLTYGLSPDATIRAEDIRADWPNRLSLTVRDRDNDESVRVQTQFCGAHLVPNVLAAMAVGRCMGVGIRDAADAIAAVEPVPRRMFPIEGAGGVTFIQDDVKASVWAIPAALEFLRHATAGRRILIVGNLSDYQEPLDPTYLRVAKQALEAADYAFFVGRWATRALRAKRHPDDDAVQAFVSVAHLNTFLRGFLKEGDLVLLKGSDHDQLSRVVSAWQEKPAEESRAPGAVDDPLLPSAVADVPATSPFGSIPGVVFSQLVVGLGNPGKRFAKTPHNVGQQALDYLAATLGAEWSEDEVGWMARARVNDGEVLLVKPATQMNVTGPWMRSLAESAGLTPRDCVVVHDDINLKPAVVRNRMSGSSGGHKGMQSIIGAFQSEDIRRVKIGVGLPPEGTPVSRYVLTPMTASTAETVDQACRVAASRVQEMIEKYVTEAEGEA